jgi:gas vesicle protein
MAEDNTGKLAWFFAGAAIGASIALLYAPSSGEVTRRRIGRKVNEQRDRLAESGRDLLDRSKDVIDRGKRMAEEAADVLESGRKIVQG